MIDRENHTATIGEFHFPMDAFAVIGVFVCHGTTTTWLLPSRYHNFGVGIETQATVVDLVDKPKRAYSFLGQLKYLSNFHNLLLFIVFSNPRKGRGTKLMLVWHIL